LATTDDARVHCAVLKIRAVLVPHHRRPKTPFWCDGGDDPTEVSAWRPFPQDPTACSAWSLPRINVPRSHAQPCEQYLLTEASAPDRIASAPLTSWPSKALLFVTQRLRYGSGRIRRSPHSPVAP